MQFKISSFFLFSVIILLTSCSQKNKTNTSIIHQKDYDRYLTISKENAAGGTQLDRTTQFWSAKLAIAPTNSIYQLKLANSLSARFKAKGNIEDIHQSDELLKTALTQPLIKKSAYYHALSSNAITQHQFQPALAYANKALETKEAVEFTQLIRFDVLMELGELETAEKALNTQLDKNGFDYLIRKSKLQDAQGDLMGAIRTLELTKPWLEAYKNQALYCWTMSNLADMYGHAGQVQKSYNHYLKVLQMDNDYYYALKGIAWIAYSNDRNIEEARRILAFLQEAKPSPDYDLMLAEMADYQGNELLKGKYLEAFTKEVTQEKHGQMYESHLADVYLSENKDLSKVKKYAANEIKNRPTAQSYLLLARYYHENKKTAKAMRIIDNHVAGKTEEPDVLLQIGLIAQSNGNKKLAKKYLAEAIEASFELGPVATAEIQLAMKDLK